MRRFIIVLLVCVFLMTGCNSSPTQQTTPATVTSTGIFISNNKISVSTLTPFQPITAITTQSATYKPQSNSTPTLQPGAPLITAIRLGMQRPSGQVNILLLGSDYRPKQGFNTDVIMVLSLNPAKGTATLTSFPRDLYVNIPGKGMNRINASQALGGFELTAATLKGNFDVDVDYYIMTNFSGFKYIVDALDGITVYAGEELTDTCTLPQAVNKMCHIPVGNNTMNGATALWYVRSRDTTNDFDRTRRAQEVISAIFKKAMSLNALDRAPELYDLFTYYVESNLPLDKVLQLLPLSTQIIADPSLVKRYAIGPTNVINHIVPSNGAMVLIPDPDSIREIIRQAFYQ